MDTKGQDQSPSTGTSQPIRRIGLMGGSFDPIHLGHLLAAEHCREQLQLDELHFVVAATSPFKLDGKATEARHRLEMARLATGSNPAFHVDDRELNRGGTSYTVETLREIRAERPQDGLIFLMGADALADFDKWREPGEICRLAEIVVVARGGYAAPDLSKLQPYLPNNQDSREIERLVRMPQCEISSSYIRAAIAAGRSTRYQVTAAVQAYIEQYALYR